MSVSVSMMYRMQQTQHTTALKTKARLNRLVLKSAVIFSFECNKGKHFQVVVLY